MTDLDRFTAKIRVLPNECWEWTAFVHPRGYGVFSVKGKACQAHRWAYEHFVGPIPAGTEIDHRCHDRTCRTAAHECPHRRCVNPDHLQATGHVENVRRGNAGRHFGDSASDYCKRGHPLFGDNLYVRANGTRKCRTCQREAAARYAETGKGKAAAARRDASKRR